MIVTSIREEDLPKITPLHLTLNAMPKDLSSIIDTVESTYESDDGMRRSHTGSVTKSRCFHFENIKEENGRYSCDLYACKYSNGMSPFDLSGEALREVSMGYSSARSEIGGILLNYGYAAEEIPMGLPVTRAGYRQYHNQMPSDPRGSIVEIKANEYYSVFTGQRSGYRWEDLLAEMKGQDNGQGLIRLATNGFRKDFTVYVDAEEVIKHNLFHYHEVIDITPPEGGIKKLIEDGSVSTEQVKAYFRDLLSKTDHKAILNEKEWEMFDLFDEQEKAELIKHITFESDRIDDYLKYDPDGIYWEYASVDCIKKHMDLFVGRLDRVGYQSDTFVKRIAELMKDHDCEKKLVENAGLISNPNPILSNLHECSVADVLRHRYNVEPIEPGHGLTSKDDVVHTFNNEYDFTALIYVNDVDRFSPADTDDWWSLVEAIGKSGRCSFDMAKPLLYMGKAAGIDESKIVAAIEELCGVKTYNPTFDREESSFSHALFQYAYKATNCAEGMRRAQQEMEDRKVESAMRDAYASDMKKWFSNSTKGFAAVKVEQIHSMNTETVCSVNFCARNIGKVCLDDKDFASVSRLAGCTFYRTDYLINVDRARKCRDGVLHIDVMSSDAGTIIGRKGSCINKLMESLNRDYGCSIKRISLHSHDEEEYMDIIKTVNDSRMPEYTDWCKSPAGRDARVEALSAIELEKFSQDSPVPSERNSEEEVI